MNAQKNAMVHLGFLMNALYGATTVASGLACTPTVPASMQVTVGQGAMISMQVVDASAFGSLPSDSTPLVKLGSNLSPTTFNLTAPSTSGQSINYLIEGSFVETDNTPVVLPYFNAANPAQPFSGPNNSGTPQNTKRAQVVSLQLKAGAAANAGTQATPAVDIGWVGLYVVTVNFGQNTITNTSISTYPNAPFLKQFLQSHHHGVPGEAPKVDLSSEVQGNISPANLPTFGGPGMMANVQQFTAGGTFTVPAGVTKVEATVTGGGGGGSNANAVFPPGSNDCSGGGGGAGGTSIKLCTVTPGQNVTVTVGAGGAAQTNGGSSSFGSFCSATGGVAAAFSSTGVSAGGIPGTGTGGDINLSGGYGSDGQNSTATAFGNGGTSYWGGGSRARVATGSALTPGAPGSGGGGAYDGTGNGNPGAAGLVVVRW